jgi:branched-chain amino acid transport system ATP-binding protein
MTVMCVSPQGGAGHIAHRGTQEVRLSSPPTQSPPAHGIDADLELGGVTVRFGGLVALDDVGLRVAPRTVHGVIGPNGAGKTTLFNVACGFVRPDEGRIVRSGAELTHLHPHDLAGLGVARTLQGLGLFDRVTVLENVMTGADRHAGTGFLASLLALPRSWREEQELRERAMATLSGLGIAHVAGLHPGSLPYPVRKRVALARALVAEPALLLLDEPASGLSADEMDELGDLITTLTDRMSVLLVEHHMDLVMRVCDEITVLDFGRVIARGTPDEVRNDPAVLTAYLGEDV